MDQIEAQKNLIREIEYILRGNDWSKLNLFLNNLDKSINIPSLFAKIKKLPIKLSQLIMSNIQIHNVNLIFDMFRDINYYGILEGLKFSYNVKDIIKSETHYNLILECIKDLFGPPSEQFVAFVVKEFPSFVVTFLEYDTQLFFGGFYKVEDNLNLLKDYLQGYTMYGLNIRKISDFREFLQNYDRNKKPADIEGYYILEVSKHRFLRRQSPFDFLNFESFSEVHLINDELITKIRTKRESKQYLYEFPIISMVIRGGLGPQGKGFAYLTPFNEICEICSDANENKAYILEYKRFLKKQFLNELQKIIDTWEISEKDKIKILEFLDTNIQYNVIDSSQIDYIYNKIDSFFTSLIEKSNCSVKIDDKFRNKLKAGVQRILVPIEMQDQFLVRMNLIKSKKIDENEVAKLVSLGEVSHYDMLVQRFFFQNLIEFMIREYRERQKSISTKDKKKSSKKDHTS